MRTYVNTSQFKSVFSCTEMNTPKTLVYIATVLCVCVCVCVCGYVCGFV